MSSDAMPSQVTSATFWHDVDERNLSRAGDYVMRLYWWPLKVYYQGSSFRGLFDADEVVNSFFVDRLSKPDFLVEARASGKRLRHWLMNAMIFYLREELRRRIRDGRIRNGTAIPEAPGPTPATDVGDEEIWYRAMVHMAIDCARTKLESQGKGDYWILFEEHVLQGAKLADIARRRGVESFKIKHMINRAKTYFHDALVEAFENDGVSPDRIDEEMQNCLAVLSR